MSIGLQYGHVSPGRYPNLGWKRKSTKSAHPAGKKKKEEEKENVIQPMTPEDCDPVVREVVEDTRAAVEEMMKELKDMVDQTTQTPPPPPQFTLANVYELGTPWCALATTCVWRPVNLKRDGTILNVPCNRVCFFVGKTKPLTI